MPQTFSIQTLGCKLNRYDSDSLAKKLLASDYVLNETNPDICIVNSCTVTHNADRKSRSIVKTLRKNYPQAQIIVMGCGTQLASNSFLKLNEVDFVARNIDEILKFLKIDSDQIGCLESIDYSSRTRAPIKIQTGCENFCSYCIIPFTRGRSKNRPKEAIVAEIKEKEQNGFKEIVLTGINIAAYGSSQTTKPHENTFADLLNYILDQTDIPRLRLGSLGPEYFNAQLIQVLQNPRYCRHLHLSLQSGCDRTLKAMNRHYDTKLGRNLVANLYQAIPGLAITTDIIVGFPGETAADFQKTCEFAQELELAKIHVFPFSPRAGTVAADLPNQISNEEKKYRSQSLREINKKLNKKFVQKNLNKRVKVLWEQEKNGKKIGLSDNYLEVISAKAGKINTIEEILLDQGKVEVRVGGI